MKRAGSTRLARPEDKTRELQQSEAKMMADVPGEQGFARSLSKADLECLFAEE